MKKTLIAVLLAASSLSALASDYYVVVPVPNRTATAGNIVVTLSGYSIPAGIVGRAYAGFDFNSVLQVRGDPQFSAGSVRWAVVGGTLPAGLTLGTDGKLSGTPTMAASSSFQVMAAYKTKAGQQAYLVLVSDVSIALSADSSMPVGVQGAQYSYDLKSRLTVTGDAQYTPAQVSWSVGSGSLPSGLLLNANGTITGVPNAEGTFPFTIKATYLTKTGQQGYQVIVGAISVGLAGATVPGFLAGYAASYDLKQHLTILGDAAYTNDGANVSWNLTGTLPAGLALGTDGRITGTPSKVGSSSVTVTAGYKTKTSAQATYGMSVTANVKDNGGYRTWSDGTLASSCQGYQAPGSGSYAYAGSTGDGVYRINASGLSMDVFCDMTTSGGPWTLLMKQAKGDGVTLQGDSTYWTNGTTLNDTIANLNRNDGNLVSAAFGRLPVTQLKLQAANESSVQTHSNSSAMTAQAAFSDTARVGYSDPNGVPSAGPLNWFIHASTYPNGPGQQIYQARFGFNFYEHTTDGNWPLACGVRWGWTANENPPGADYPGSSDACGGLGAYGQLYGGGGMSSKNVWQPATLYLWGK